MFEVLYNSEFVKNCFVLISLKSDEFNYHADHGYQHAMNVIDLSITLAKLANLDDLIEDIKIAALLHDVGNIYGKDNHAENSYLLVKEYFQDNNIKLVNEDMILEAIRNHSGNKLTDNIICKIITLADKLDVTASRVREVGKKVPGMRQIQNISKIDINVVDNKIVFNFCHNEKFDKSEFKEYYFYKKIIAAIIEYADFLKINPVMSFNGIEENLDRCS